MLVFVNITKLSIQHFKTNSFVVGGNGWVGVCLCIFERKYYLQNDHRILHQRVGSSL